MKIGNVSLRLSAPNGSPATYFARLVGLLEHPEEGWNFQVGSSHFLEEISEVPAASLEMVERSKSLASVKPKPPPKLISPAVNLSKRTQAIISAAQSGSVHVTGPAQRHGRLLTWWLPTDLRALQFHLLHKQRRGL